ncbi:hypothetical protein DFH94DRAFT_755668 [Russula ochroleuca]|uniref:Uncharacterized protein n=1 Tax=Russula ochroleuca TaxID=152965 RepID=A0A9P5MSP0_9AGAM|nr:hypothetical protein DFH94DRAFT_755668 [Russula ochroleuca]
MGEFRMDPIQTFQHERISVLIDNSRRSLFLETAGRMQVFDDIWDLNACIIFKDVRGKLVGDSVVGAAIQGVPNLWCFMNLCDDPPLAPSPTVIPTQITSAAGLLIRDWRKAIRLILRFPGANIHITDKPFLSSGTGSRIDTTLQSRRRLRPLTRASQLSTTVGPG